MKPVDSTIAKETLRSFGTKMAFQIARGRTPREAIAKLDKKGDPIAKRIHPHLDKGKSYKEALLNAGLDSALSDWFFPGEEPVETPAPVKSEPRVAPVAPLAPARESFADSDLARFGVYAAAAGVLVAVLWRRR